MRVLFEPPQRVPIHLFANVVDRESERRLRRLATLDHVSGPIAVLPDVHPAGESVVGTVVVSTDALYPTLIGDDIGCGMASARLPLDASSLERADWERVLARIADLVPSGRRTRSRSRPLPGSLLAPPLSTRALDHERERVGAWQFATLGEGNHFLELQRDPDDRVWITVHSGSRGIGGAISRHHAGSAPERDHGWPLLPLRSAAGQRFLMDQAWALHYAAASRSAMLEAAAGILASGAELEPRFDVTHNAVSLESHLGVDVAVHRKGAMPTPLGGLGIVPGSMGTASYIVEGLGAAASYTSCSHGAGRLLTRAEARRRISVAELRRRMAHVVYRPGTEASLVEEAPQAYKDVREVLSLQADLVVPRLRLTPLAVLKG